MAGFMGAAGFVGFVGFVGVVGVAGYCRVWWVLQELFIERKKTFFFFYPHTLTNVAQAPCLSGVQG